MKNSIAIVIICITVCLGCKSKGDNKSHEPLTPLQYNDSIINLVMKADSSFTVFFDSLEEFNLDNIEKLRENAVMVSANVILEIERIGDYNGDSSLQEAALKYILQGYREARENFGTLIKAYKKADNSEESDEGIMQGIIMIDANKYEEIDSLSEIITEKDIKAFEEFDIIQREFAWKYKIAGRDSLLRQRSTNAVEDTAGTIVF